MTRTLLNQQGVNLHIFTQALDGVSESLTLTCPPLDDLMLEEDAEYTTIFPVIVCLGNYLFCAILKIKGYYVKNGVKSQCASSETALLETFQTSKKDIDGFCGILDVKLQKHAEKENREKTITINRMNRESEKALFWDVEGGGIGN